MGKKQYLALVSLGDLTYDDDFLKKAKKIEGIKRDMARCGNSSNHQD